MNQPIIDLVPKPASGSHSRHEKNENFSPLQNLFRFTIATILALIGIVVFVRLGLALFAHGQISQSTEKLAAVTGASTGVSAWINGTVKFILVIGAAAFGGSVLLNLLLPFRPRIEWAKAAVILVLSSGFLVFIPEAIQKFRGVDSHGKPETMVEIDPGSERWFAPNDTALIFYADHLDGQRRFWNRDGATPFDSATAFPVTAEVRKAFEDELSARAKEAERKADEQERKERLEREEKRLQETNDEVEKLQAQLQTLRKQTEHEVIEPQYARIKWSSADNIQSREHSGPTRSTLALEAQAQEARKNPILSKDLVYGHILRLDVGGRLLECWSDGTMEMWTLSEPGRPLVGKGHRRRISNVSTIFVKPLNAQAKTLYLEWIDGIRGDVTATYLREEDQALSAFGNSNLVQAPLAPKFEQFPLTLGRVSRFELHGDTVEVSSNGANVVVVDNREYRLQAEQRLKIPNGRTIYVSPADFRASSFRIQPIAPGPGRMKAAIISRR